jgi:rhamnosyl/mannosyltransferase
MRHVDRGTLLVAGDGERRDELERQASVLGVDDRVRFLGYVGDDRLLDCYSVADVFVLPSVEPSEAFGIVQLEAMAHGLPVVNTDLPSGVPWVSQDGRTGLTVPPRDPEALATAVRRLLEDESLRERFGENARRRVETEFSEDRLLSQTLDVYRTVSGM